MTERRLISIDDVRQKYRDFSYPLQAGVGLFEDRLNIPHNLVLRGALGLGGGGWTGSNDVQSINNRATNYFLGGKIRAEYA